MESKVWPRTCAVAERLWSDPIDTGWKEAETRILEQRRRMAVFRDIHADAIQPEFCRQNDGFCYPVINNAFNAQNMGLNQDSFHHDPAEKNIELPAHLKNVDGRDLPGRLYNHDKTSSHKLQGSQVRDINDVVKWTVFVIVLLVIVMFKRRFVCSIVLRVVEYCRTIANIGITHWLDMRFITIR